MDINIIAAMEAAELVLERMSLEKGGRGGLLVNTASLAGVFLVFVFDFDVIVWAGEGSLSQVWQFIWDLIPLLFFKCIYVFI